MLITVFLVDSAALFDDLGDFLFADLGSLFVVSYCIPSSLNAFRGVLADFLGPTILGEDGGCCLISPDSVEQTGLTFAGSLALEFAPELVNRVLRSLYLGFLW